MNNQLKPCPFCGERATLRHEPDYVVATHYAECNRCEAQGGADDSPEKAAAHWNRRTPEAAPDGWALVPIKPTKAMRDACRVAGKTKVWDDMMAARPQPEGSQ